MHKKRTKTELYDDSPLTAAEMKTARRLKDDPAMKNIIKHSLRGRPAGSAKKEAVTISLDKDVAARLRSSGSGWQTRLNDMVRTALGLTG
jgi:uncharacterized protein (DUF4415 family)